VITAAAAVLPPLDERDGSAAFAPLDSGSPLAQRLDDRIARVTGSRPAIARVPGEPATESRRFHRRGSGWLCRAVEEAARGARLPIDPRRSLDVAVACSASYLYFSGETGNPFSFKTNLEHQTPARVGDALGFVGPQYTVREGDSADLASLATIASAFGSRDGAAMIGGISDPHHLLSRLELAGELDVAQAARAAPEPLALNTRFSEGAAAVLVESRARAEARAAPIVATIAGSYQCLRALDYRDERRIEAHLERCVGRLLARSAGGVHAVYGCFRRNEIVADLERSVLSRLLPRAALRSTVTTRGDLGPVSGLVDVALAVEALRSEGGGEILVHKVSRTGHYAGVLLRGAER
jgi:hypothetical protein